MTAGRRLSVLGLVLLLAAAAAAAADTTVTAEEVVSCTVDSNESDALDTLAADASVKDMKARCREMDAALRLCGRSGRTAARLLREVDREAEALAKIPFRSAPYWCGIAGCGLLGGTIAAVVGAEASRLIPFIRQESPL